ncbi:MAG: pyridoxamine kinase [Oscillospiraceae bacterium]|nr:pyridoxamine kinase [Oscillospiraceae bacterium]
MQNRIPSVACINDISGYGRCSLTIALPVLSVMGIQACPVPTAVLSKHTGFEKYSFSDLTDGLEAYFESWSDLHFDWIYSGFLGSLGQIEVIRRFFHQQKQKNPRCRILLDPVMGDDGKRYTTYTQPLCDAMRALAAEADIITPNITEACILTGESYHGESLSLEEAKSLAEKLTAIGCKSAVITGIVQGQNIGNLTYENGQFSFSSVQKTECLYSGTGDLFASIACGALAHGKNLCEAAKIAGTFLSQVTKQTLESGTPPSEGVAFEPMLYQLGGLFHA